MYINDINVLAADALCTHGWIQGKMESEGGSMCLVGALRHCSPQPGDWVLAREVYRGLDHAEEWNDMTGRTADEVVSWLRTHPVTDDDLKAAFGPQWEAIVRLIRQAATLTWEQADALDNLRNNDESAAWLAARDAASKAGRIGIYFAAQFAVVDLIRPIVEVGEEVVEEAIAALVVDDLVGQHGLTQAHIDALMGPWVSVMGDPRINIEE